MWSRRRRLARISARRPHAGRLAGKAGHSESLMKRDSEVCWSRMRLPLLRDPSEPERGSLLSNAVVKSQLNSSSIIITICFPEQGRGGWGPEEAAGRLFSLLLTLAPQCCQCFWWPSHHDFTSELIPAIGHVWHLVHSRRRRLHSGNTRFITSLFLFSPRWLYRSFCHFPGSIRSLSLGRNTSTTSNNFGLDVHCLQRMNPDRVMHDVISPGVWQLQAGSGVTTSERSDSSSRG